MKSAKGYRAREDHSFGRAFVSYCAYTGLEHDIVLTTLHVDDKIGFLEYTTRMCTLFTSCKDRYNYHLQRRCHVSSNHLAWFCYREDRQRHKKQSYDSYLRPLVLTFRCCNENFVVGRASSI